MSRHNSIFLINFFVGTKGNLRWNKNWVTFLDAMLQISVLKTTGQSLRLPTRIKTIYINPETHRACIKKDLDENEGKTFNLVTTQIMKCGLSNYFN